MAIDSAGTVYVASGASAFSSTSTTGALFLAFPSSGSSSSVVGQPLRATVNGMAFSGSTLYAESLGTLFASTPPGDFIALGPYLNCTACIQTGPSGLAAGPNGWLYEGAAQKVVELDPQSSAAPQRVAGTGAYGSTGDGGPATQATLEIPAALAVNPMTGDLAIFDRGSETVRVVSALSGDIQTVAGAGSFGGDNGPAMLAVFNQAQNLVVDGGGDVLVADSGNLRIRKITPAGIISTVAGTGVLGAACDGKASQARIYPSGPLAIDQAGNLYFLNNSSLICKLDLNGNLSTLAGGGTGTVASQAQGTAVKISASNLAASAAGYLYFNQNYQIFQLNPAGVLTLVAGNGMKGDPNAQNPATSQPLGVISAIAVDSSGRLYFGDGSNNYLWMIDSQGMLNLVAGDGSHMFNSQPIVAGPATQIQIGSPENILIDASGNVYFQPSAPLNPQVVMVDPSGLLTPIAGGTTRVLPLGSTGDGGPAASAYFTSINGLAMDAAGDIYVSDGGTVGAGGSVPPVQAVSAGGEVTVYGANFFPAGTSHVVGKSDLVNGKVPTNLAGVCVNFGTLPAAILAVYPSQINLQVGALPVGAATVQVTVNCGAPNAVASNIGGVVVQPASPEFYSFLPSPTGNDPVAAITLPSGSYVGPPGLIAGGTFAPAKPGAIVEAYGTGWGDTTPSYLMGVLPGAAGNLALPYSLALGGVTVPPANILYAGISPCCAGFYQVDFTVPSDTPSGNQSLVITVAGEASPPGAYIAVQ
jgi:uncharacterized protein (TIGR03437 family)